MGNVQMLFSAPMRDARGQTAPARSYLTLADTTTLAQLLDTLASWGTDIQDLSDAEIQSMQVRITTANLAGGPARGGLAVIEQTGVIGFRAAGTSKRYSLYIPAFSNLELSGDRIDLGSSNLLNLVAEQTGGVFTNEVGQDLTGFAGASLAFHKFRKQLQRSSFET